MAGFDPTLDNQLFKEKVTINNNELSVSVMSYNEGMAKIQIGRSRINKEGETSFAKLGRLTIEEAEAVAPMLAKAIEFMKAQALNPDNAAEPAAE